MSFSLPLASRCPVRMFFPPLLSLRPQFLPSPSLLSSPPPPPFALPHFAFCFLGYSFLIQLVAFVMILCHLNSSQNYNGSESELFKTKYSKKCRSFLIPATLFPFPRFPSSFPTLWVTCLRSFWFIVFLSQ